MSNLENHEKAIVVLGMHRGGTSATTRALQTIGVDLGDELLAASPENPRGFFEDEPLLEISDRVLAVLGMSWSSPRRIRQQEWQDPRIAQLELEAAESIRRRFSGIRNWGFKNPRSARLLPFWESVLEQAGRRPSYLIVLRNPLSVAASLQKRNGLSARRAHLLWLLHMSEAVIYTRGKLRLCVDYDMLVSKPSEQLDRIAHHFGLPEPKESTAGYQLFVESFLSAELRNTRFEISDVERDSDLSSLALSLFGLLSRWSKDDPDLSESRFQRAARGIHRSLGAIEPILADLAETDRARSESDSALGAEQPRLEHARRTIATLEEERAGFERELIERRAELKTTRDQIGRLEELSASRDAALQARIEASTLLSVRVEGLEHELSTTRAEKTEAEQARQRDAKAYAQLLADSRAEAESREKRVQSLQLEVDSVARTLESTTAQLENSEMSQQTRTEEWTDRHQSLTLRLEESEQEVETARRRIHDLERDLNLRTEEVERQASESTARARARIDWLKSQTHHVTAQLVEHVDALVLTRQWRVARSLQRGLSRLRRRAWLDGMAQLQTLALALHAETNRESFDLLFLADLAGDATRTLKELSSAETFAASRHLARLRHALRRGHRPDGPFELVRNRLGELHFHLSQLATAPDLPRTPPPRAAAPIPAGSIVDIVIPVFKAREATLRCIQSVLDSDNRTPTEIVVIDDASDDPRLLRPLEAWAKQGRLTLLRNERNQGFPATANRGMSLHPDRHVVLLNSDTLVHGDWLDRLRRKAHADPRIATVTPFSNNAEICSYPEICRAGKMPSERELADLDTLVARVNRSMEVTLPTAIGFCMYVRREAIQDVGLFDTDRFGRGYGEENDFCLRARERGFRHVLATDVFVAHEGGLSFSDTKQALIASGLAELDRLHPSYRGEIHKFIGEDPVLQYRRRIDIAQLLPEGGPSLLMVSHSQGGGTDRHVVELARHLEAECVPVLLLQPVSPGTARLTRIDAAHRANLEFRLPDQFTHLVEILREARVAHVHLQHMLGLDLVVRDLPTALGCSFDVTLHDFMAVCPRIHLIGDSGRYCGLPDSTTCTACVQRNGSVAGFRIDVEQWRQDHRAWLGSARRVFVPSEDTRLRLAPFLPEVPLTVRPHPETYGPVSRSGRPRFARKRKVVVIGAIGVHKGADVLEGCARDAAERQLPLDFHLIGYSDRDPALLETGKVTITGPYEDFQLPELLRRARGHLAFIPSVWPETFCYTLSAAFQSRVYPIAFELGAVADRIGTVGWGALIPLDSTPAEINDYLLAVKEQPFPSQEASSRMGASYRDYRSDYYDGLMPGVDA